MSNRTRIPPALEPYLQLPSELSLILLTSTLGCSTIWLTTRLGSRILHPQSDEHGTKQPDEDTAVVLVSFLRDAAFWKNEIRRATVIFTHYFSNLETVVC